MARGTMARLSASLGERTGRAFVGCLAGGGDKTSAESHQAKGLLCRGSRCRGRGIGWQHGIKERCAIAAGKNFARKNRELPTHPSK